MESPRPARPLAARLLLALALAGLLCAGWFAQPWVFGALTLLLAASALATLGRSLQLQNVCAAAACIVGLVSAVLFLNAKTSMPFGPLVFTADCGDQLLDGLPPTVPLLWLAVLITARGVARLVLRPWRKLRTYGFRVIGLTMTLTVLFDLGLEPFATRVQRFWVWQPTAIASTWFGAPWINCFGWAMTTLLLLAFATPWLINKMPSGGRRPPDFQPLLLWGGVNLFLAMKLATHTLWVAVAVVGIQTAVVTALAWKNGR
jgi:uncharacterized membrane protein